MSTAAKSFTVGPGGFTEYLVFGPFPRLSLVDSVTVYVTDTVGLTGAKVAVRIAFFPTPPSSVDEMGSGHYLVGPFDVGSAGQSFYLPIGIKRQPQDTGYVAVEMVGNNGAGNFTAGAIVTTFPPQSTVEH